MDFLILVLSTFVITEFIVGVIDNPDNQIHYIRNMSNNDMLLRPYILGAFVRVFVIESIF